MLDCYLLRGPDFIAGEASAIKVVASVPDFIYLNSWL